MMRNSKLAEVEINSFGAHSFRGLNICVDHAQEDLGIIVQRCVCVFTLVCADDFSELITTH